MRKVTLTIGLTRNEAGGFAEISKDVALTAIQHVYSNNNIDSYTVVECVGYWKGAKEQSLQVIAINSELPAKRICEDLKTILSQDCIAVEITDVIFQLI